MEKKSCTKITLTRAEWSFIIEDGQLIHVHRNGEYPDVIKLARLFLYHPELLEEIRGELKDES